MQHVQIMRAAAPIFNANPDGGVYLMTLSVAVMRSLPDTLKYHSFVSGHISRWEQYAILGH
jgi:hypothetical protein